MNQHVRTVAYTFMIFSALAFLVCLAIMLTFAGIMSCVSISDGSPFALLVASGIGVAFMTIVTIASLPGFLAGYGLLKQKSWGRPLAIIMAFIYLFGLPVGTILGVYALWVLFNEETEYCFHRTG